jgi:hypothetical protein
MTYPPTPKTLPLPDFLYISMASPGQADQALFIVPPQVRDCPVSGLTSAPTDVDRVNLFIKTCYRKPAIIRGVDKDGLQTEHKDGMGRIVPSGETAGIVSGDVCGVIVRFQ